MRILENYIEKILKDQVSNKFSLELDSISFNIPPNPEMGDLSTALPIILTKKIGKTPTQQDFEIADPLIEKIELKNNYLNIYINWQEAYLLLKKYTPIKYYANKNILLEHTSVNPNKPLHIGHLRNAIIGDVIAKIYTFLGAKVDIVNYIDDTGLQMAELIFYIEKNNLWEDINNADKNSIDELCGKYYILAQKEIADNIDAQKKVQGIYRDIENRIEPLSTRVLNLVKLILKNHLQELDFLGVTHKKFIWESELITESIVEKTIKLLKQNNIIVKRDQKDLKNCYVLPQNDNKIDDKADKIIIKSDGTITYTGKDIAFQLWKFNYWKTNENNSDISINIIDDRQSYTQEVVKQAIGKLKIDKTLVHLSYQVVALSSKTYQKITNQKASSNIMMMKGRKGVGFAVKELINETKTQVNEKNKDQTIADNLVKSAIRAYILKYTLNQMIVFDIEEALKIDGETGVYLNYSYARICQLLNKIKEPPQKNIQISLIKSEKNILKILLNIDKVYTDFIKFNDPQIFARQAFDLCQAFNTYYDDPEVGKIINQDLKTRSKSATILNQTKLQLEHLLDLLGIEKLEKI